MSFSTRVGDAEILQVTELDRWTFPAADLFPAITDDLLEASLPNLHTAYYDAQTRDLVLAIHTYVIRLDGKTILVDSGNGNHKQRPNLHAHHMFSTDYLQRLASAGVTPADVAIVISTHLHPDHCGWNTTWTGETWIPTFPNAKYLFATEELVSLGSLAAEPPNDPVGADLLRTFEDSVRPVLSHAQWAVVDDGFVIARYGTTTVVVRSAPGHTAGHIAVEISTDQGGALISGDVIHHPIQLLHPGLNQAGDSDPAVARATRDALLRECATENLRLLTAHFATADPVQVALDATGGPVVAATLTMDGNR